MEISDVITWERTFTEEDIRLFNQVSGDEGIHHIMPDEQGHLMVHGLLTATIPTKIGGDMNFIAREMRFQFHRPVFAGDTVKCEAIIVEFEPGEEYINVRTEFVCRNQHGKEVMTGHAQGIVRRLSNHRLTANCVLSAPQSISIDRLIGVEGLHVVCALECCGLGAVFLAHAADHLGH